MTQLPISVHVGSQTPDYWDDIEARQRQHGEEGAPWLQRQRRPTVANPNLDWGGLGLEPRWVGSDTADCAAALEPSIYSGQGADEFIRFRQGAESRSELALVISPIGDLDEESRNVRNVFGPPVASVSIGQSCTSINGDVLGKEATVHAAADISEADGQLALRLLTCNPAPRWRRLTLTGASLESTHGRGQHPPDGTLIPILETQLVEAVVAAWVSTDEVERRYIVPAETPWPLLLQWLLEQALPEFVPGAMRRARRLLGTDVSLMTRAERAAFTALTDLEADYIVGEGELERRLNKARTAASAIREGLLYGTSGQLVIAVRSALESAGITVMDLDEELGGTKNADLLCSYGGRSRLVEVKAASGSAPERAYQDLVRHLREWPTLAGTSPVEGGALILNHEHRKAPLDRSRRPFERPEFLTAQTEPVIPTLNLFDAWREEDSGAIRRLLFGSMPARVIETPAAAMSQSSPVEQSTPEAGRRRWFGRP